MSKPSKKPEGRPISDERGNFTWKWAGDTEVETAHLRALTYGTRRQARKRSARAHVAGRRA